MKIKLQYTSESASKAYGENGPQYGSPMAAAFDLRAMIESPISILPSEQVMIPTGIKLDMTGNPDLMPHMAAIALPRSGRGSKEGLVLGNLVGLMDQDYQGEIMLCCWARPTNGHINAKSNRVGGQAIHIEPGERIAQLMFVPILKVGFDVVDAFGNPSARGEGGFGSSGMK